MLLLLMMRSQMRRRGRAHGGHVRLLQQDSRRQRRLGREGGHDGGDLSVEDGVIRRRRLFRRHPGRSGVREAGVEESADQAADDSEGEGEDGDRRDQRFDARLVVTLLVRLVVRLVVPGGLGIRAEIEPLLLLVPWQPLRRPLHHGHLVLVLATDCLSEWGCIRSGQGVQAR